MDTVSLVLIASLVLLFIWAAILTFLYFSSVRHYKKLSVNNGENLENVIKIIFKGLDTLNKNFDESRSAIGKMQEESVGYVQKVVLSRFNPFGDTGGDQSFSLVLLDKDKTGVILSSLHGRSGTRVYAKPVNRGKPDGYEFSEEEEEVVKLAGK